MFILIYSDCNTLSLDNEVEVFPTLESARKEMRHQFAKCAANFGYALANRDGDVEGVDEWGDNVGWIGFVNERDAYLDCGEDRWVIRELPGTFIPADTASEMRESIDQMEEIYADEGAGDYWDADDIAIGVARTVGDLISE